MVSVRNSFLARKCENFLLQKGPIKFTATTRAMRNLSSTGLRETSISLLGRWIPMYLSSLTVKTIGSLIAIIRFNSLTFKTTGFSSFIEKKNINRDLISVIGLYDLY